MGVPRCWVCSVHSGTGRSCLLRCSCLYLNWPSCSLCSSWKEAGGVKERGWGTGGDPSPWDPSLHGVWSLPAGAGQLLDKTCFPFASRNSQPWLEQMRELKETAAQVSAARGNILQAVREVLGDHGVQEEKREVKVLQVDQRPRYLSGLPPVASSWHSQSRHPFRQLLPWVF